MDDFRDEIQRAVNYAAVCGEVKAFVEQRRDKLIETLANALALHLLETFEIRRVAIELRKYVLPKVKFVSVTVTPVHELGPARLVVPVPTPFAGRFGPHLDRSSRPLRP